MYHANRFLTPQDKATIRLYGNLFLTTYMRVASEALQGRNMLFKILPKMHLLTHVWNWDHRNINASYYSTWLDEDFLKKIGKTLGLTSQPHAQKRLLQRWLMTIPRNIMEQVHGVKAESM